MDFDLLRRGQQRTEGKPDRSTQRRIASSARDGRDRRTGHLHNKLISRLALHESNIDIATRVDRQDAVDNPRLGGPPTQQRATREELFRGCSVRASHVDSLRQAVHAWLDDEFGRVLGFRAVSDTGAIRMLDSKDMVSRTSGLADELAALPTGLRESAEMDLALRTEAKRLAGELNLDAGDVYHFLRGRQRTPTERLRRGLNHGRRRPRLPE